MHIAVFHTRILMSNTDEAIQTFADAFAQLSNQQYHDLYVEALECIVRMAKAEVAREVRLLQDDEDIEDDEDSTMFIEFEIERVTLH
jgi:hypothetical protein